MEMRWYHWFFVIYFAIAGYPNFRNTIIAINDWIIK